MTRRTLSPALEAEVAKFSIGALVRPRGHERLPVGIVQRIMPSGRVRVKWGPPWAFTGSHKPHTLTLVEASEARKA